MRREDAVSPNQRHTANVRRIEQADRGRVYAGFDGFVTDQPEVPLVLRYADCTPVLIDDPERRVLAVVHSGWRGTVQGAVPAAIEALAHEYGSRPADMVAGIGPSIGPCCYEVGTRSLTLCAPASPTPTICYRLSRQRTPPFRSVGRQSPLAVRRWRAPDRDRRLLHRCRVDEFYSYRAEKGKTGHFGAIMALRGRRRTNRRTTKAGPFLVIDLSSFIV